jgi:S1-C subfamily serine protease
MFSFSIGMYSIQIVWDLNEKRPLATSFSFLRPNWVVTAKHVVMHQDLPRRSLGVQFGRGLSSRAKVYAVHPRLDVAVLQLLDESPCNNPLFPSYARFTGQKGLVSIGYVPSLNNNAKDERVIFANIVEEWEVERRSRDDSVEEIIVFDSPHVEPGHSGGPMIGEGGGVVGVVIQNLVEAGVPRARATSIVSLLDGLDFTPDWQLSEVNEIDDLVE